ncbi:MAG TPA: hypothetical protein VMH00_16340 [Candidatus Limnocylindrales bacterium]|nr:hypothetical protein [Candidatus Limnocylindrales bacterium]
MNDWADLDRALQNLAASGAVEVREDGEWLAGLSALHYEVRRSGKSALVHLWSDERNLARRVLRVREQSPERLVLEVQRFGRSRPGRLEFLRTDSPRAAGRVTREQFRARFSRFLAERFPDSSVDFLSASPDLEHSFSGVYIRGRMHEGSREHALIAASPGESSASIEGILTFGILWLDWCRSHAQRRTVEGLRVFVPEGTSRFIRERSLGIAAHARLEVFEFDEREGKVCKTDPADVGNLESWLAQRREVESDLAAARDAIARVRALAPAGSELAQNMAARPVAGTHEVAMCFRGLEFARWRRDGITFGIGDSRDRLTERTQPRLERLARDLDLHRHSLATETNHPLYRAAPERWLETLVMEEPARIDAQLDPRYLYSEVPALAAGDRGVLDVLGVTLRGRLVIIELKATENIQLPMQAVDYWLRVRRHQLAGDFRLHGYFAGLALSAEPPLVWLVAPGLRFHASTDTLLKYLSPEIHVTRIGINENWRRGVKVLFRQ